MHHALTEELAEEFHRVGDLLLALAREPVYAVGVHQDSRAGEVMRCGDRISKFDAFLHGVKHARMRALKPAGEPHATAQREQAREVLC
ncbi:MAG: hypothetical protein BWY76_03331 [bacterium ADurb.Bin429]|nr:MAG: hypothetical protein BWY76_03331 [bacterium ADurb.Bin429]